MSPLRFLDANALPDFLKGLKVCCSGEERRVLVPTKQGASIVFAPYTDGAVLMDKASISPKEVALPRSEELITFHKEKDTEQLDKITMKVDATPKAVPTVVFGCRPCDARGFTVIERPYTKGPHADPYFAAKLEKLVVISRLCTETCSTCFCHWVGSGPLDNTGSDIVFTEMTTDKGHGYVFEAITEKGKAILEKHSAKFAEYTDNDALKAAHKNAINSLDKAPDLSKAKARIAERFEDSEFWEKQTAHCLSCGACTYICPTCYCFNLTDEGDGLGAEPGKRLRTWDNCMASHFTREASGHNPRVLKAYRMRNRVSHKFSNYPSVWNDEFSCNGCGRCISQCPVHLDIRAIVLNAIAE